MKEKKVDKDEHNIINSPLVILVLIYDIVDNDGEFPVLVVAVVRVIPVRHQHNVLPVLVQNLNSSRQPASTQFIYIRYCRGSVKQLSKLFE